MKGKIFVLFIMVGIPVMAWAFLAWVTMLAFGVMHGAFSIIPSLSFLESLLVALMLFSIMVFLVSMATTNARPARRHDGR